MTSDTAQDVTVSDLPYFDLRVGDATLGSEIARFFEQNPSLPGVIVMDGEDFRGMVSRNQFFQRLGRLFGVEVYSTRPITALLDSLAAAPLVMPEETTIQNAAIVCLARPAENVYDPFVVTIRDGPPRLIDFLALILKQTELLSDAQAEAQAQKASAIAANNAKSEFLANMSHELRTPLTAIIGYGEILLEDCKTGELQEAVPRLENIVGSGLHLLEMINSILDLSKIEARKMDLAPVTFALPDFLDRLAGTVSPLMQKNRNEFSLLADENLGEMHSDETKLKQCLINLLGNAAKFTHDGRVVLRVGKECLEEEDWAVFQVTDTGIGMNESQMRRLFEPFYQADSSISRRYGGTGLGLSLTKEFCELLGGHLSVESAINQGTTFTLKVPFRLKESGDNLQALSHTQV